MDFCQAMLNHVISMQFYWKDRHEGTIFLLFIYISWNNWLGTTLNNHLRYWSGFIITFQTELDYTWAWITLSGYEKYLTGLLNNINFWFFKPHNIRSSEVELDESGNILDVLLTCVTMTYNTHSCIKSAIMWMDISSCANYRKMEL